VDPHQGVRLLSDVRAPVLHRGVTASSRGSRARRVSWHSRARRASSRDGAFGVSGHAAAGAEPVRGRPGPAIPGP
jgi:hypothetical protein